MSHRSPANISHIEYSRGAGVGFLRIVLLFGSAAVSLGLILIPLLMQQADRQLMETLFIKNASDPIVTGSIKPDNSLRLPLSPSLSRR